MIRLDRKHVKPPATWKQTVAKKLADHGAFLTEAQKFELLGLDTPQRRGGFGAFAPNCLKKRQGKPYFPSAWGEAKEKLAKMSNDKCAYCEGGINASRAGQVEHFKPKALFPSLAYDWDNYFLACGGCNGAKSDRWPDSGEYLRPDQGDPTSELLFKIDGTVEAVKPGKEAEITIKHFELNRTWLVRRRKKNLKDVLGRLKDTAEVFQRDSELGLRLARNELGRLRDPENAYSAALTQCFLHEWKLACPSAQL